VATETLEDGRRVAGTLETAFRADDAAAADVLATHLLPLLTRLVRRLMAWSPDADDLVQETLVVALTKRKTFRGDAKLETWMTRIAINCCRSYERKRSLRSKLFGAWARRQPEAAGASPADSLCVDERASSVRAAVAKLPPQSREAIVLCYLEGLSVEEAAAALNVRRGTVEVRLSRARSQLRRMLSSELFETE
jgi:RNA polymerase sigma-70 factor (ECF subfamily)